MPHETGPSSSLEEAVARYETSLDDRALSYLRERGIDESAARSFRLGQCADPAPGHERFRGYLSIPTVTRAGVKGIKFRCLQDHECDGHGKYDKPAGQRNRIYNPSALLEPVETVAICEGELDAIVCSSVVGVPAVGVPGVSSWKEHFPRCFTGFSKVIVIIDNDDKEDGRNPGRELGDRIARDLEQAVVISPPKGHDLTSWYLSEGVDPIRKACGI